MWSALRFTLGFGLHLRVSLEGDDPYRFDRNRLFVFIDDREFVFFRRQVDQHDVVCNAMVF
jgi:hypothetical protein